jgi:hypothetical protein
MGDITTGCTFIDEVPNLGRKMMYVETEATADAADTIDMVDYMASIDMVISYNHTDGALENTGFSGTVITLPVGDNQVRAMLVIGK